MIKNQPLSGKLKRLVVLAQALLIIAGIVVAVDHYSSTAKSYFAGSSVQNLTDSGFKARINYGQSPKCADAPQGECWLAKSFDASSWEEALLPSEDIKLRDGFKSALANNQTIYYRFNVPVSDELQQLKVDLSFTPVFVNHKRFESYVNGRLVAVGRKDGPIKVVNLPFQASDIIDGTVFIVIKAETAPDDIGIRHRESLYVGPQKLLDFVYPYQDRVTKTYFLIFLISKGSIFVVFSLLFFFTVKRKELSSFLFYAFFVITHDFVESSFSRTFLTEEQRIWVFFLSRTFAISFLVLFIGDFLRQAYSSRKKWLLCAAYSVITTIILLDYQFQLFGSSVGTLFNATHHMLALALAAGIWLGFQDMRALSRSPASKSRKRSVKIFVLVMAVALLVYSAEFYFGTYVGLDKRSLTDLGFFIFIALASATEYAQDEETIDRQVQEVSKARVVSAIAQTTQMFAHDVRRPLNLARIMMTRIEKESSLGQVKALAEKFSRELDASMSHVTVMVEDLLEAGDISRQEFREESLVKILGAAIDSIYKIESQFPVSFLYRFNHKNSLYVVPSKVLRVLVNILSNAKKAIQSENQTISFISKPIKKQGQPWIRIGIENTGSKIAKGNTNQVFNSFYTQGSRSGTGLGLAICENLVLAHGGQIWCDSNGVDSVCFWIELPACRTPDPHISEPLPKTSVDVRQAWLQTDEQTRVLTNRARPRSKDKPQIVVVDDDIFILEAWEKIATDAEVIAFDSPVMFFDCLDRNELNLDSIDCVVTDFHFGEADPWNGKTFARALRDRGSVRVVLSSHFPGHHEEDTTLFERVIDKAPQTWASLKENFSK